MNPDEEATLLEAALRVLVVYGEKVDRETVGGEAIADLERAVQAELGQMEVSVYLPILLKRWGWQEPRPVEELPDPTMAGEDIGARQ